MCSGLRNISKVFFSKSLKLAVILSILLAGCGGGNSSDDNTDQSGDLTVFFILPDGIPNTLPASGVLSSTISVNGVAAVPLTISSDNTSATATISDIPTGNATIAIIFTYNDNFPAALVIASLEQTITVSKGNNSIIIQATDFVTSIHDEDGDGLSNLDELDENSNTNPFISACIVGTATLGNCEL